MSDKRKKQKFAAKREQRRLNQLDEAGRLVGGVELPRGAIPADPAEQVPNNSYSPPPEYYLDIEFACKECGRKEVWTARQQKWFYEVAKGSLYATAVHCRECRRERKKQRAGQGDPNPIKHHGALMKRVRQEIEPALSEVGLQFEAKSSSTDFPAAWFDFSRPGLVVSCILDLRDGHLVAQAMNERGDCTSLATEDLSGAHSTTALLAGIDSFVGQVRTAIPALDEKLGEGEDEDA